MGKPIRPRKHGHEPGFPAWTRTDGVDASRRRFLKQLTVATGGATVLSGLGLPRLGQAQGPSADFSLLDAHPDSHALSATAPVEPAPASPAPPSPMPMAAQPLQAAAPTTPLDPAGEWVTEDRALWVDPGYLVLLRWSRPLDDLAPIAALEGAAAVVGSYLRANAADGRTELHDLTRLHAHEASILGLLAPRVSPAIIEVLHLDHDCRAVCGPAVTEPENIPLPGIAPSPDWE